MEEVWNLHSAFPRVLDGWSSIEILKFSSAVCEWRESLAENPGREPALCSLEGFEALNRLQPSVELLVHALDEIRRLRTINVEEGFCSDVGREFLTALEDVIQGGDLHGIIVMPGRSPPDASLQTIFAQVLDFEDMPFDVVKERPVLLFTADFERATDVL